MMLFGLYHILDVHYVNTIASGNNFIVNRPSDEDTSSYMKIGEECIGWISIKDTSIDYPIMQTKDNTKYLNTAPDGSYSLAGSIFLDANCSPRFDDGYSLIHGHHMGNYKMFGEIDKFFDKEFFDTHKEAEITFDGEIHKATVFAFVVTDANRQEIFDPTSDYDRYNFIKTNATYIQEPVNKERIIALGTCKDPGTTQRSVLFLVF